MLSTSPAGGGSAGETTTGWNTGSGWLNDCDKSIASSPLKCSDHFWSIASTLLSVGSFATLTGDLSIDLPLSLVVSVFLFFTFLLLDYSELFVFLAFTPGVLLSSSEFKSCPSFATLRTDTKAGSTRVLLYSSWMAF